MSKRTALITGGAGFIGSNLASFLLEKDWQVRVIDNLSSGKRENLSEILDKIDFIESDICNLKTVNAAVKGVDFVFHKAAIPSVSRSVENPLKTNETNIVGTLNILEASKNAGVSRIIYAASSSAYGDAEVLPKVETMPAQPLSPYALQKYTAEVYCNLYSKLYGLETIALRYFNIFGPKQDPNSLYSAVIPIFIKSCLKNESPTIFGDGEQTRDFTYIENVMLANFLASKASKEAVGEVVNIAGGKRVSLNSTLESINNLIGTNVKPIYKETRAGDVRDSLADLTKAKNLLGYEPIVGIEEGLQLTINYLKKELV